jgi:hypothetical protein
MEIRYVTWLDYPNRHAIEVGAQGKRYGAFVDTRCIQGMSTRMARDFLEQSHRFTNETLWRLIRIAAPDVYRAAYESGLAPIETGFDAV